MYTVRLHEKGQALLDALTGAANLSQSEVVAAALEHYAKMVYNQLIDNAVGVEVDEVQVVSEKTRPLKQALTMIGK